MDRTHIILNLFRNLSKKTLERNNKVARRRRTETVEAEAIEIVQTTTPETMDGVTETEVVEEPQTEEIALTPEQIDENWQQLKTRAAEILNRGKRHLIEMYRDMGTLVMELRDAGEIRYGAHNVDDLADELGIKKHTLLYAERFCRLIDDEEYQHMIESDNVPAWRGIQALISASDEARSELLAPYIEGEYNSEELREQIRNFADDEDEPEVREERTNDAPDVASSRLRAAVRSLDTCLQTLQDLEENIDHIITNSDDYGDLYYQFLSRLADVGNRIDAITVQAE